MASDDLRLVGQTACALVVEGGRAGRPGCVRDWETVREAGARRAKTRPAHSKGAGDGKPLPF